MPSFTVESWWTDHLSQGGGGGRNGSGQAGSGFDPGDLLEEKAERPGHYRLSIEGVDKFDTAFYTRFGLDVAQEDFSFGWSGAGSGYTIGNSVTLNSEVWQLIPENQEFTLAHEMTHSVQYGELGTGGFLSRYLPEWCRGQDANYGIPDSLLGSPVNMSNIVSPSYTLDQIAQQNAHLVVPDNTIGWWKRGELN
jgi:hypothetical protein